MNFNPVFVVTLQDVIGLSLLGLMLFAVMVYCLYSWFKQAICKHKRVYENMACHAICSDCRKDLGFIGTWREEHKNGNV